jgi:hypothetical protein
MDHIHSCFARKVVEDCAAEALSRHAGELGGVAVGSVRVEWRNRLVAALLWSFCGRLVSVREVIVALKKEFRI